MTLHRSTLVIAFLLAMAGICSTPVQAADAYQEASRLYKDGRRADALEQLNAVLAQNPKDARARFLKGVILTEQNKPVDAIAVFSQLTADYPELPEPYNNLAVLYAGQGDYEKARKSLEMAIRTHPSYAVAHENLGDIYATLASQAYDKALQLDSNNSTARKKLALIKELIPPAKNTPAAPKPEADRPAPASRPVPDTPPAGKPPATAPADKPAAQPPRGDPTQSVLQMLDDWTRAWSNNDAAGYLSFYAPDFDLPEGETRKEWEDSRRARLAKPKKIQVTASLPQVKFTDNNHAAVTFRQNYSSDTLKALGTKTLRLVRSGDRWLIQQELIEK